MKAIDSVYTNFWGREKPKFTDMELALMEGGHSLQHDTKFSFLKLIKETAGDPLGAMLAQKGLAPPPAVPTGPSDIDQAKLDQIMQRIAAAEQPQPDPPAPAVQATPTVPATITTTKKAIKAKPEQGAKPKAYVPVTKSPFELVLRKAALGAKMAGAELAAFMGQCAHESAKFTTTKEFSSGTQYEGRADLGNTQPGDGARYKGRGFIQITGRANYTAAGKALGIDLVNHPELAERPDIATKVSIWYWNTRVKPRVANFGNTKAVTKKVNGGVNGLQDRTKLTKSFQVANK
jgi:predicted chitinase